ncbi:hypothetical protein ABZ357_03560 [Streptomyces sp. NPDC005917]|uniref:hypothetical protein n=1 Tax=unclassified Streptomyces TaxID=2593676 RepID=UPI00340E96EC
MVTSLGDIRDVLAAAAQDKADVYQNLGLKLTYERGKKLVRAEAQLDPHKLEYRQCPRGDLNPHAR